MTARPPDDVNRRTFEGRHRKIIVVVDVFEPADVSDCRVDSVIESASSIKRTSAHWPNATCIRSPRSIWRAQRPISVQDRAIIFISKVFPAPALPHTTTTGA